MKCDKKTMTLYAVTDRAWVGRQSLYEQVEAALRGGATCVQLREKDLDEEAFLAEAMELAACANGTVCPFSSTTTWTSPLPAMLTASM